MVGNHKRKLQKDGEDPTSMDNLWILSVPRLTFREFKPGGRWINFKSGEILCSQESSTRSCRLTGAEVLPLNHQPHVLYV